MRTTPGGAGGVAVGRHRHEVDLERQRDGAGQVGHEHGGALEDADQQRSPARVVRGDLGAELRDPGLQRGGVDHHLAQVRAVEQVLVLRLEATRSNVPGQDRISRCRLPADLRGRRPPRRRPPRRGRRRARARRWRRRAGAARRRRAASAAPPGPRAAPARRPAPGRRWGRAPTESSLEQVGVGPEAVGLAGEDGGDVALGDGVEQREQLVADAVAPEPGVVVRRVVRRAGCRGRRTACGSRGGGAPAAGDAPGRSPPSPSRPAPRSRLRRTVSAWSSAVCPVRTSAGQHVVAGPPGPRLEVRAVGDHRPRSARKAAPTRGRDLGDDVGLGRRPGPQPVVDVHRRHVAHPPRRPARAARASRRRRTRRR